MQAEGKVPRPPLSLKCAPYVPPCRNSGATIIQVVPGEAGFKGGTWGPVT